MGAILFFFTSWIYFYKKFATFSYKYFSGIQQTRSVITNQSWSENTGLQLTCHVNYAEYYAKLDEQYIISHIR